MRTTYVIVAVYVGAVVLAGLVLGASTLLDGGESDADPVHVERIPVVPERPADPNATGATDYGIEYERTRLYNDVIASHDHTLETDERVLARCNATSVTETGTDRFSVRLRCEGGIEVVDAPAESTTFAYTVTYRITETETNRTGIRGYPFGERDALEPVRSHAPGPAETTPAPSRPRGGPHVSSARLPPATDSSRTKRTTTDPSILCSA